MTFKRISSSTVRETVKPRNVFSFRCLVFMMLLAGVGPVLLTGCASSENPRENWTQRRFGKVIYETPPGWVPIEKKDSTLFSKSGRELHFIKLERVRKGTKYDYINRKLKTNERWYQLAKNELNNLKNNPEFSMVELKLQKKIPRMGSDGFLMKVRIMDTQGMRYLRWIVGGVTSNFLYRVTVEAERYGHYSTLRENFMNFLASLKFADSRPDKKSKQKK